MSWATTEPSITWTISAIFLSQHNRGTSSPVHALGGKASQTKQIKVGRAARPLRTHCKPTHKDISVTSFTKLYTMLLLIVLKIECKKGDHDRHSIVARSLIACCP